MKAKCLLLLALLVSFVGASQETSLYSAIFAMPDAVLVFFGTITPFLPAPAASFSHPDFVWPASGKVTSGFGLRVNPQLAKAKNYRGSVSEYHAGIDISTTGNAPVKASADGEVAWVKRQADDTWTVSLKHQNDFVTIYNSLSRVKVATGDKVKQGDTIGLSGGPRGQTAKLFFQIKYKGQYLDPLQFLPHSADLSYLTTNKKPYLNSWSISQYKKWKPIIEEAARKYCGGIYYKGYNIVTYTAAIAQTESDWGRTSSWFTGCGVHKNYPKDKQSQIECTVKLLCSGLDGSGAIGKGCPSTAGDMSCVLNNYTPEGVEGNPPGLVAKRSSLASEYDKIA